MSRLNQRERKVTVTDTFRLGPNASAKRGESDLLLGNTLEVQAGPGIATGTGTIVRTGVQRVGNIIHTEILVDLTGLRSTGAGDIIGVDGTSLACYIGQVTAARCGTILSGTVECLEVPAGGDPDIDLYSATEATGVEDAAITSLAETQLTNGGDHTLAGVDALIAVPAADEYLYLVAAAATDADYTAGKLLIRLQGYDSTETTV